MVRIAQVAPLDYRNPGGMQVHVMCLSKELNLIGFKVDIICLRGNQNTKLSFIPVSKFNVHEYDIVHTHGQYGSKNAIYRLEGKSIVHTYHGVLVALLLARGTFLSFLRRYYIWLIAQEAVGGLFAHRVITVSNTVKKEATRYYGMLPSKMTVIPNGHCANNAYGDRRRKGEPVGADCGVGKNDFVFLYVGRGEDPVKGMDRILGAFRKISVKYSNTKLILIPGLPEGTSDPIFSTGNLFHGDVKDFYLSADALVNSSYYEAFPVTIPEAMAAGLPVIAPRVGGITDIIKDGVNGILVDKDCRDLAEAMERVYLDDGLRAKLGRNSRETSKGYTWRKIAVKTAGIYREIL